MVAHILQRSLYGFRTSVGASYSRLKSEARSARPIEGNKEAYMFIVLFAILLLAWLGGFLVFHVSSALIHILLLFAVISLIAHLFQRKTVS
jgi:hypothetical protein